MMTDETTEQAERDSRAAGGRPSLYTPGLGDDICARLALGQSLRSICREDAMPDAATVYRWLRTQNQFRDNYEKARADQADALADEILEIADDGRNDWMERRGDDGSVGYAVNSEHIQRSRLRVDSRKWIASKLKPKKYGDKISQEVTGADGAPLLPTEIVVNVVKPPAPAEG